MPDSAAHHIALTDIGLKSADLIHGVEAGQIIVLTRDGLPVAQVIPIGPQAPKERRFGSARGRIEMAADFDELLDAYGIVRSWG